MRPLLVLLLSTSLAAAQTATNPTPIPIGTPGIVIPRLGFVNSVRYQVQGSGYACLSWLTSAITISANSGSAVCTGAGAFLFSGGSADSRLFPTAASALGGIKVGANLSSTSDGTLSAPAPYTDALARIQAQQAITALGLGTAATQPASAFYAASNPAGYITAAGSPVRSVAGRTGAVTLGVADVTGAATTASVTAETTRATTAEGALIPTTQKGAASGVAPLDATSRLPAANLTAGVPTYYNSSGLITGIKCWEGRATTVTGGTWTLAFSGVTFTAAPVISVQAISAGTTLTLQYVAFPTAPTATGVSGTAASGTSLSVLGATLVPAPAGVSVHVTACGG